MKKLLIANRGEIAVRIVRAARDYGLRSVAIYSDADATALHARIADEAWGLGPGRPADTYLNIARIIECAQRSGADAIHPGYGFLSESAEFAEAVMGAGLVWVGPSPETIRILGDKLQARRIAASAGAPLVKGSDGALASAKEAVAFAHEVGLPIAIKAVFGGGGRGLKVARRFDEVADLYDAASREAIEAFGKGDCYAEQFLDRPRHVEAQILADCHGRIMVLGTRDCTLQRRNQKLVEEAPAPFLSPEQEYRIRESARSICAEARYISAGTVEFLLSATGVISFLEVNTRLQVEHGVTEEATGCDIVVEQLRIADGLPLSLIEAPPRCHAIEFRINAEDPGRGFLPTPGRISRFDPPSGPGIRLDSGVETGSTIPDLYDSLMAKLIVTGPDRKAVLSRARRAFAEFQIEGVASTLSFHRAVIDNPDFASDDFRIFTSWIEAEFPALPPARRVTASEAGLTRFFVEIDGQRHEIALPVDLASTLSAVGGVRQAPDETSEDRGVVTATIAGTLLSWLVPDGAEVTQGEPIAIIESMKMETRLPAPRSGRIFIQVAAGAALMPDTSIARIAPLDA